MGKGGRDLGKIQRFTAGQGIGVRAMFLCCQQSSCDFADIACVDQANACIRCRDTEPSLFDHRGHEAVDEGLHKPVGPQEGARHPGLQHWLLHLIPQMQPIAAQNGHRCDQNKMFYTGPLYLRHKR